MTREQRHTLHELVWSFREQYNHLWPTPEKQHSAHFTLTEVAEALDAYLRQQRVFKRNSPDKQINLHEELGDTALMLVTTLGKKYKDPWDFWESNPGIVRPMGVETIVAHVLKAWLWMMEHPVGDSSVYENEIWKALSAIDLYTGDAETLVRQTLDKIFHRHVEPYLAEQLFGHQVKDSDINLDV